MKKKTLTLRIEFSEGSELKDEIFKAMESEYKGAYVTAMSSEDEFKRLELIEQCAERCEYLLLEEIISMVNISKIKDIMELE